MVIFGAAARARPAWAPRREVPGPPNPAAKPPRPRNFRNCLREKPMIASSSAFLNEDLLDLAIRRPVHQDLEGAGRELEPGRRDLHAAAFGDGLEDRRRGRAVGLEAGRRRGYGRVLEEDVEFLAQAGPVDEALLQGE